MQLMDGGSHQEQKLIVTLTARIQELIESHSCPICHEVLNAPVLLPCSHIFCSLCVRRHLSRTSTCPQPTCRSRCTSSSLASLREYDATLVMLRVMFRTSVPSSHRINISPIPLPGNLSRAILLKKLTSAGLSTNGGSEALKNRYREYVLRVNAASDSACGASKQKLVDAVRRHEAALSEPQKAVNVFRESPNNELTVRQGDNHEELVRKIKRRKRLLFATSSQEGIGLEKSTNDGEGLEVKPDYVSPQKTTSALKRPRSATVQNRPSEAVDGAVQVTNSPRLRHSTSVFAEVALKSVDMSICPGKRSPGKTPPTGQSSTQITPPPIPVTHRLTREQRERINRNKMAAMEKRRQNSQRYVRRLPFTSSKEDP